MPIRDSLPSDHVDEDRGESDEENDVDDENFEDENDDEVCETCGNDATRGMFETCDCCGVMDFCVNCCVYLQDEKSEGVFCPVCDTVGIVKCFICDSFCLETDLIRCEMCEHGGRCDSCADVKDPQPCICVEGFRQ